MEKINLFCLPFAGGSLFSYRSFVQKAPHSLNIISLELPGRGRRVQENLCTDLFDLVEDVFRQIQHRLDHPYAIYGHSMGSVLGYLLTRKICQLGLPQPLHLFFTGRRGPCLGIQEQLYKLPRPQFVEKLRELGGSSEEVLSNADVMDFFEPVLKADFQALETYQYQHSVPLDIPIIVMIGSEENTTPEMAMAWQRETRQELELKIFKGHHFFIFDHVEEILEIVANKLEESLVKSNELETSL
jgi:surfactin synthase thioesterase subunit